MIGWIHRLLNPHCEHCLRLQLIREGKLDILDRLDEAKREEKNCESCDTLRRQLEIRNHEYEQLLQQILNPPKPEVVQQKPVDVTRPTNVPWRLRRQMLETEDRKAAELMNKAPKPQEVPPTVTGGSDVEQLEKELGVDDALRPSDAQVQAR